MADYQRMYAMLCSAVAAVIPALEEIPAANPSMRILQQALLNVEELYIQTTPYVLSEETESNIIKLQRHVP